MIIILSRTFRRSALLLAHIFQTHPIDLSLHVALKHIYYIPFLDSEVQPSVHPKFANLSHPAIPAAVESGLLRQAVSMNMYSLQKFFLGSLSEGA